MYLRPGTLFSRFIVESKNTAVTETGRKQTIFAPTGNIINGVLADAKTAEMQRWKELQHSITHTIVQKDGRVSAKEGDRLINGGRFFYIQGIDDVSMLGAFVMYYVEERSDYVDGGGSG